MQLESSSRLSAIDRYWRYQLRISESGTTRFEWIRIVSLDAPEVPQTGPTVAKATLTKCNPFWSDWIQWIPVTPWSSVQISRSLIRSKWLGSSQWELIRLEERTESVQLDRSDRELITACTAFHFEEKCFQKGFFGKKFLRKTHF